MSLMSLRPELLEDIDQIYYSQFRDSWFDDKFEGLMRTLKAKARGRGILPVKDTYTLLGEQRVVKSAFEVEQLQKAATASSEAFVEIMKATKPGKNRKRASWSVYL